MNIDFWFEFGSTYSYPAAMRVEKLASQHSARGHFSRAGIGGFTLQLARRQGSVHVA
jgi:2-hydroxychromene-2-carboxylate isomerase